MSLTLLQILIAVFECQALVFKAVRNLTTTEPDVTQRTIYHLKICLKSRLSGNRAADITIQRQFELVTYIRKLILSEIFSPNIYSWRYFEMDEEIVLKKSNYIFLNLLYYSNIN